jgi:HSP20 family molecular chaperone IbpA
MNEGIRKLYFELMKRLEAEMEEAFGKMWRRYVGLPLIANHVGNPSLASTIHSSQYWRPAADVLETEKEFIIRLEIAGLNRETLRLQQSNDGRQLWLQGERRDASRDVSSRPWYHQLEIYFGPFELEIVLPPRTLLNLEDVDSSYENGILLLRIAKRKAAEGQKKRTRSVSIE